MKRILPAIVAALLITLGGCGTGSAVMKSRLAVVQEALDAMLPASFVGDVHAEHNNPYFSFSIDAGYVHRGSNGWEFTWLVYKRKGFSNGTIVLGTPPRGVAP